MSLNKGWNFGMNDFLAHWCVSRNSDTKSQWRPYSTLLCSCCMGEEYGSINLAFPSKEAYEKIIGEMNGLVLIAEEE